MVKRRVAAAIFMAVTVVLVFGLLPVQEAGAESDQVNQEIVNKDINKTAGNLVILTKTKVNGDVTLNLGELTVYGVVNGNVKNNMGQVNIEGNVNGDVETNMGQVIVNGNVSGDVKTRMGDVVVDGSVGGNVITDLGETKVGGSVGGNIGSGFGELRITGTVGGDVKSAGGIVIISGIVEGDVNLEQGIVELEPNAVVSGKVYVGRGMVNKADTATAGSIEIDEYMSASQLRDHVNDNGYRYDGVNGDVGQRIAARVIASIDNAINRSSFDFMPDTMIRRDWPFFPFMTIYGSVARGILNMLILFALAALTYTLFPSQVKASGNAVLVKPGPVIGWGVLAAILAVPLMVLLVITIIGIPLIVVEIVILAAAALLGYTAIAHLVGNRVIGSASSKPVNPLGAIALGVLLIGLISLIPILGSLISLAIFILGVGSALVTRFGANKPAVIEPSIPDSED